AITATSGSGDLRLQKGFLLGGTASAGFDTTRQNTNNLRADINPATSGGLALSYVQPLLRGFGLAVNNRYIRIANNNRQVADLVFEQQVTTTAYTVTRLYWDLVTLTGQAAVQRQTLALAERLLAENIQQEQAGTLAPIDVTRARAEVARARRDLTVAETSLRQQETILKDYLTRGTVDSARLMTVRVVATDNIPSPDVEPVTPIQDLVETARGRRPEVLQAGLQTENARIALTGSRSSLLPALDLVVNARSSSLVGSVNTLPPASGTGGGTGTSLRQPDPAFIGGFGTGISQLFGARFPDYSAEVQLTIPILNRIARADHARDQLAVRQQQIRTQQLEKQLRVEIVNALIAVEQSRAALQSALEARTLQEQSLDAERERYAVGASTNFLVIQYQRDLAVAQQTEVVALSDYAKARAALQRATGTLLDQFGISIVDAFRENLPRSEAPVGP
ncbi:MAG TPA: TolC family protein, partial [Bryobacteraceae bacterium]|nr:TolC family protein [Bryobacteraceae bacterium]